MATSALDRIKEIDRNNMRTTFRENVTTSRAKCEPTTDIRAILKENAALRADVATLENRLKVYVLRFGVIE